MCSSIRISYFSRENKTKGYYISQSEIILSADELYSHYTDENNTNFKILTTNNLSFLKY